MTTPTSDDFRMAYDTMADAAVKTFNARGEHPPMLWFVQLPEQQGNPQFCIFDPQLIATLQDDTRGKDAIQALSRSFLRHEGALYDEFHRQTGMTPDLAVYISEAWMVRSTDRTLAVPPSQAPDRQECLVINVHSASETRGGMCPITRTDKKATATLAPMPDLGLVFGRMSNSGDLAPGVKPH